MTFFPTRQDLSDKYHSYKQTSFKSCPTPSVGTCVTSCILSEQRRSYEISIYGRKTSVHGPFKDIRLYMILFQAFLKQPRFHNVTERDVTDIHFRDIAGIILWDKYQNTFHLDNEKAANINSPEDATWKIKPALRPLLNPTILYFLFLSKVC